MVPYKGADEEVSDSKNGTFPDKGGSKPNSDRNRLIGNSDRSQEEIEADPKLLFKKKKKIGGHLLPLV